ncbi:MFS transporter [Nonomuraea dietziae]|uniref:MFS transporter n=1 Tax=Nonomuraea dietziae TaxID=65515 RepID=UPI0033EE9CC2
MRAVLGRRDVRPVFLGMAASLLGDASLLLIPSILAKKLTGSDGAAGLALFFFTAPMCLAPLFGMVIDRADRRRFLIGSCLVSAVALLPLALVSGQETFWLVYPVSMAMGCSYTAIFGALSGLLKTMLPCELLAQANNALQTARHGARLLGPLLGMAIYTGAGLWAAVAFDMLTFAVAAVAFALLPTTPPVPRPPFGRWRDEVTAGLRHIRAEPEIRSAARAFVLMFLAAGLTESLIFAVIESLGRSPEFTAVTSTAMGLGAIAGGFVVARAVDTLGELRMVGAGIVLYGLALGMWLVSAEAAMVASMALAGAGLTLSSVAVRTLLQRRSPDEVVGRVSTAFDALGGGAQLLSVAAGAAMVTLIDHRLLLVVVSTTVMLAGFHAVRASGGRQPVLE